MKKRIRNLFPAKLINSIKFILNHDIYGSLYQKYKFYTMVPSNVFKKNLEILKEFEDIKGCIVECGVWRGGMSGAMSEVLKGRKSYLYDSFEGLPEVKAIDGTDAMNWQKNTTDPAYLDNCKAEMKFAEQAMQMSGGNYKLIKGWFNETLLNELPEEPIAILRLDADWYESTLICLKQLYPRVVKGGLILIDDYNLWDGCSKAIHDYLSSIESASRIYNTGTGVTYIIKKD